MNALDKASLFLRNHGMDIENVDIDRVCGSIISEMELGLKGEKSSLEMIPTYVDVPRDIPTMAPVAVIDAGGTNFRTGLAQFTESMEFQIQSFSSTSMPGTKKYLTKKEFFQAMADIVRETTEKSDKIGFCFSYPIEIHPNRDGRLIRFVKEIKAPEVEGEFIGKNLLAALGTKKKVVILNDTVATLLAGKASAAARAYSSYIGFILGTGLNGSYIESCSNIGKLSKNSGDQIINTELGNFNKLHRGTIDQELDQSTLNPGVNSFEKMISGGYLGDLVLRTLQKAAKEGLVEGDASKKLMAVTSLRTEDVNDFLCSPEKGNVLADICVKSGTDSIEVFYCVALNLVERAAKLAAAALSALSLKSGAGRSTSRPICITVEGSTFYELKTLRDLVLFYVKGYLTDKKGINTDIVGVKDATIKGAAIAGLS